jgi:membrane fusion protein (multidrug efflux system)
MSGNTGMSRGARLALMLAGPLAIGGLSLALWLTGGRYVYTDNAYLKSDMVGIGPRVAGVVTQVSARSNAAVREGDLLFAVDRAPLEVALVRAEAALAAARTDVEAQRAALGRRRAELAEARVALAQAERESARLEPLLARGIVPRSTYDRVVYEAGAAREQLAAAERAVGEVQAALGPALEGPTDAHPRVQLAAADLERARLDLRYAEIRAPSAGTLATVTLHVGEHVEPGQPVLNLVAGERPWIEANLKETQLEQLVPGQPATVEIDAYPGVTWRARVDSIGPAAGAEFSVLPPENASGNWVKIVQRVPVRLVFDDGNPPLPLRAGTSVEVTIDTGPAQVRHRRLARRWSGGAS